MANKLADILSQESSGIMFPFRTNVKPVKTEQQVYTPTEGIMNVKGTAYEGPSAVITYGTEEQGYPRQLKEIEKGMLPQFDQSKFPEVGKGKIETPVPTTPTTPTQPVEPDKPLMDPCPPGFKYDPIKKMCVPIEQPKSDRDTTIAKPRNLTDVAKSLKGNIDFTTGTTEKDEKFRAGQYDYEPSRKEIEGFNLFSIAGSLLHNLDQSFNEKEAIKKGILIDTTGDGKPDKIDMTQVTRNYQEEEIGLPAGARAFGATESLKADVQYDTAKKLYQEGQLKGTPPVTAEEEKTVTTQKISEEVTPRFEGSAFVRPDFGMLTKEDFGNLNAAGIQTQNTINEINKYLEAASNRPRFTQNTSIMNKYRKDLKKAEEKQRQIQKALEAQKVIDEFNKERLKKQQEELEEIKKARSEGKEAPRQVYDKPRTQKQRQRETGQTAKQRASRTSTTGKFERAKAGPSVSGERLRGGI